MAKKLYKAAASWTVAIDVLCFCCLLATSILAHQANANVEDTSGTRTCSNSLNLGLDYFLRTQLFANLTKLELPTEVKLPIVAFKIVNLRIEGLDKVARGCQLNLRQVDENRLQLTGCIHAASLRASFMLRAGGLPLDFVQASIKDTGASARVVAHMVPGGLISLENLDIVLGDIKVENTGISGSIITWVMKLSSVRERIRKAIVAEATKKIKAELSKTPLPS